MAQLTMTLGQLRRISVDPATIATVCNGVATLCEFSPVSLEGVHYEIRAKVRRLRSGSLHIVFDIVALVKAAAENPVATTAAMIATNIACNAIWDLFKGLYARSQRARDKRQADFADDLAAALRSPAVRSALSEIIGALQRDAAVSTLTVKGTEARSVTLSRADLEAIDQLLAQDQRVARDDQVFWQKHARITDIVGQPPFSDWRIWWEASGSAHQAWVRAVEVPSTRNWQPAVNKTLVVDLRASTLKGPNGQTLDRAEILRVLWAETERQDS